MTADSRLHGRPGLTLISPAGTPQASGIPSPSEPANLPAASSGVFDGPCIEPVDYRFTVEIDATERYDACTWMVCEVELAEALGEPFRLAITLATEDLFLEIDRLVGGRCELEFGRGTEFRTLVGVILRTASVGATDNHLFLRLEAGPVITPLGLGLRSRVFRNSTPIDIVRDVVGPTLAAAGGSLDTSRLARHGITRDHCVQYHESDLAFASRLLAEEGMTYVIEGTTMLLLDRVNALAAVGRTCDEPILPLPWVPVVPQRHEDARLESVQFLVRARSLARNRFRSSAWDWKSPCPGLLVHEATDGESPHRVISGSWHDERRLHEADDGNGPPIDEGAARLARRIEYERSQSILVQGESNHSGFAPARSWELSHHAHRELDGEYVIVAVTHHGVCPLSYHLHTESPSERPPPRYANTFEALPRACPYRPAPPEKPRIHGIQTALVVGPPTPSASQGDAPPPPTRVHTDEHGRVLLRHGWDEHGHDTCWVRVAETSEFAFSTPRIGTEVVVAFIDGDPDQPLVVGTVHNGGRRHPEPRPEGATRLGWKTCTSPSGDGYNELSFEDTAGHEEIRVHAQRNLHTRIRHLETRHVGGSQILDITRDRTDVVGRDDEHRIGRDRQTFIEAHDFTHIKGTHTLHVLGSVDANGRRGALTSVDRGPYIVRASDEIRLECGDSRIVMTPHGIEIHAPEIRLASTEPGEHGPSSMHLHAGGLRTEGDEIRASSPGAELVAGPESLVAVGGLTHRPSAITLDGDARVQATAGRVVVLAKTEAHVKAGTAVRVSSRDTCVRGTETTTVTSNEGTRIDAAAGAVTVKGTPIRLN